MSMCRPLSRSKNLELEIYIKKYLIVEIMKETSAVLQATIFDLKFDLQLSPLNT